MADFGIKGFSEDDLVHINLGWHRLHAWPDSVPGLTRLKSRFIIGPLSNGNVSLLLNMAKFAGIPWDMIFGSDLFQHSSRILRPTWVSRGCWICGRTK